MSIQASRPNAPFTRFTVCVFLSFILIAALYSLQHGYVTPLWNWTAPGLVTGFHFLTFGFFGMDTYPFSLTTSDIVYIAALAYLPLLCLTVKTTIVPQKKQGTESYKRQEPECDLVSPNVNFLLVLRAIIISVMGGALLFIASAVIEWGVIPLLVAAYQAFTRANQHQAE